MTTQATIADISAYPGDVFMVTMDVPAKYTRFKPGQFLHLTLDDFDPHRAFWPESRVFSICSTPRTERVSILYSVKGRYTTRMRNEFHVGQRLWIKLPYGDFIVSDSNDEGTLPVLIAGGTGISPYVPFLAQHLSENRQTPILIHYGVRTPDLMIFDNLLHSLSDRREITIRVYCESINSPTWLDDSRIKLIPGRLPVSQIAEDVSGRSGAMCYLSGPPTMIAHFRHGLESAGIERRSVVVDEWG